MRSYVSVTWLVEIVAFISGIEAVVVERPAPEEVVQNLCLDAGYDNPSGRREARVRRAHPAGL
jgi:hypothetical protein